jgi:DNA-binding transcriptional ArsR family regulator
VPASASATAPRSTQPVDERLVKALAHPLRQRILEVLNDKIASPSDVAAELGEKLGDVGYHVRVLQECGAVELMRTEQRRGAVKHFYRATARPMLTDEQWARLPLSTRRELFGQTLDRLWRHIGYAAQHGGFDHPQAHVSWADFTLDEQGFQELVTLLEETLERTFAIQANALARLSDAGDDAEQVHTELGITHFHLSPEDRARADKQRGASGAKNAAKRRAS